MSSCVEVLVEEEDEEEQEQERGTGMPKIAAVAAPGHDRLAKMENGETP